MALALGALSGCGGGPGTAGRAPGAGEETATATGSAAPGSASASASASSSPSTDHAFRELEQRFHAHLGLFVLDTGSGRSVTYGADRRFAMCSTAKVLAAGALLRQDDDADLARTLTYSRSDLLDHAPITSQHVDHGMPLRDVIAAALQHSDNTAENLMLRELGGPAGLQRAVTALGDTTTHVNRTEPALNEATPGDPRDTSTARALAADLRTLLLGTALPAAHRARLTDWMLRNTTGGPYVRAALPKGWKAADKTGSGGHGTRNDIAVAWPPAGAPILVSVLTDRDDPAAASDDALIATSVRTALTALHRVTP
ncbi:class A beta-lactamase [Actinacidiphila rubida]|uniref:class A beta-lactamase n=1 Tax=Actinacidiphila rubida TaxID=310780 RepID=UPI001C431B8F|nr:class A beta-lactamase [Actinacidiphila rubida]